MKYLLSIFFLLFTGFYLRAQQKPAAFVHPGMAQNRQDLEWMREKVLKGEQPWKQAFENLEKITSLSFKPEPRAHVSVGPYGANSMGGQELGQSANAAYNHALMWYITRNKAYAAKAIEILNAWSGTLWDLDENNAKLNVGLTGYFFLNAAEILKYSDSGWKPADIEQFKRLMLTVYYPTVRDFFTEANGNWDASIINTLLCIGVFTDNHAIFNQAVERYYRGTGNSGITRYIYPNGQIQETTRDWDHVQLGIGEFAKAAAVAWTQGVDFYGVAGNRLGLGFEYTSRFMLGENIPVYGVLSVAQREKFRDIYESVYQHYHFVKGLEMPFTLRLLQERTRPASFLGVLTGYRSTKGLTPGNAPLTVPFKIAPATSLVGALAEAAVTAPAGSIRVKPGEPVQAALDAAAGSGKWVVLTKGVHTLSKALKMSSGVTLAGEGKSTILFLAPGGGSTIVNGDSSLHDVTIRDLLIEGASSTTTNADPNHDRRNRSYMSAAPREGIVFTAQKEGQMHHLSFINLTVQNFTRSGIAVRGAANVTVGQCDVSDNGGNVVPGEGFHHNLLLAHVSGCKVSDSRFDTSPWGSGIALSFTSDVVLSGNETARNKRSGIYCVQSVNVQVTNNLAEGNDAYGIFFETLMDPSRKVRISGNLAWNNGKGGIQAPASPEVTITGNKMADNGGR